MPVTEDYEVKYWFQIPEPSCRPGYAGYIPGYGPRQLFQFGKTFGRMTNSLLEYHPVAGLRLANMIDCNKNLHERIEREALVWKHEVSSENNKFCRNMVSGYAGYIPRRKFIPGKAFDEECKDSIALYEKLKLLHQ